MTTELVADHTASVPHKISALEAEARAQIVRLEQEIREHLQPVEFETTHTYGPGFYGRSIKIPAGTVLTGKVHATEHIFMVTKGDITVVTEEGSKRVQAGYQAVCKAGLKRAGFAHEETVCTNIHITAETDLVKLEAALIEPEHVALEAQKEKPCLG